MNIFEQAVRMKTRFPYRGQISVEDLWDLPLTTLDSIYKTLNAANKAAQEESLLSTPTAKNTELALQIEIVKHIVATKQSEAAEAKSSKDRAAKRAKLMEIIANKQDADLQGKSVDELMAMLNELG